MDIHNFMFFAVLAAINFAFGKSKDAFCPTFSYIVCGMCIVRAMEALV